MILQSIVCFTSYRLLFCVESKVNLCQLREDLAGSFCLARTMAAPASIDPLGGHLMNEGTAPTPHIDDDVSVAHQPSGPRPLVDLEPLGTFAQERLPGDMVKELLLRFFGEDKAQERWTITAQDVPESNAGLQKLLANHCYRAAVDFSSLYFGSFVKSQAGYPHHTPDSLQIFLARVVALAKLGLYDKVAASFDAFGDLDRPDLCYDFYPEEYPGMTGTMVPFSLRLLHAVTPVHVGLESLGLDRLCALQQYCKDGLAAAQDDVTRDTWIEKEERVIHCLGWALYRMKEYALSIELFEQLLVRRGEDPVLLEHIGRVSIHLGDCTTAYSYFRRAEKALGPTALQTPRVHTNRGILAMALTKHEEAHAHFSRALALDPEQPVAKNNMAVSAVYLGHLTTAIQTLKEMCVASPNSPTPPYDVLLNLSTMHELESSRSVDRKKELIPLVSNAVGDSFPVECLKLGI